VLIADVHALGMLAVLRSLGRAGYQTHGYSSRADALGLYSRYNRRPVRAPGYDAAGFTDWLLRYLEAHRIRALIPTEALLLALRSRIEEFRVWLPLLPAAPAVYRCLSKCDVSASFAAAPDDAAVRRHLPPSLIYEPGRAPLAADFAALRAPYWIKADAAHSRGAARGLVRRAASIDAALDAVHEAQRSHSRVLVQSNASGSQQAGVNLLVADGEPLLESMMLSLHDNPHTGGTSGLRRSWWHQAMRDDALTRVRHLGWQGIAMLEYKWDPRTNAFEFIEINSRFWAALHLDLYAGADYPRRLVEHHLGTANEPPARGVVGLTSRWTLPTDWGHMLSRLRDRRIAPWRRMMAPIEFASLCFHPGVRDDLRFPGDSRLYWRQWRQFLGEALRR
jgi:predicted ATP-grasp superfamily ATP-dependent carboligase